MFEISITDGCLTLNARPEVIGAGVRKPAQSRTGRGSYLHIRRAVSHTLSSLRLSSSMESSFPTIEEAKPHWGLSAKRSSGTKRFASVMRRMRPSVASVCGRLVLINPRTTVLSSGTCRSGANEPDRSSSYSRRSRVAPMRLKIGRAIGLIVALDEPTTFLVSTTEVNGEGHVGKSPHDSVVELDPAAQPLIERPASRFIKGPRLRGEEQGIVRRVDLNIGGSEANQPRDLITEDRDDVGEEVLEACIRGLGTFRRPEIHEQAGAGQGYFCDATCAAAQIEELLGGKMPFAHEPADHAEIDRPVAASLPDCAVAVPMAPQECIDVPGAEAVDSLGHPALERKPPHFAVGHDVEPRCLLEGDGLIDSAILDGFELRVTKTPGHPVDPRFAQRARPEKTANNIGICRNHRSLRRSDRINRNSPRAGVVGSVRSTSFSSPRGRGYQAARSPVRRGIGYRSAARCLGKASAIGLAPV